jgi:hypothetical protein
MAKSNQIVCFFVWEFMQSVSDTQSRMVFEVLMTLNIKAILNVTPYSLIYRNYCFKGNCCFHLHDTTISIFCSEVGGSRFLLNTEFTKPHGVISQKNIIKNGLFCNPWSGNEICYGHYHICLDFLPVNHIFSSLYKILITVLSSLLMKKLKHNVGCKKYYVVP